MKVICYALERLRAEDEEYCLWPNLAAMVIPIKMTAQPS
jgi:hypothetical protein